MTAYHVTSDGALIPTTVVPPSHFLILPAETIKDYERRGVLKDWPGWVFIESTNGVGLTQEDEDILTEILKAI